MPKTVVEYQLHKNDNEYVCVCGCLSLLLLLLCIHVLAAHPQMHMHSTYRICIMPASQTEWKCKITIISIHMKHNSNQFIDLSGTVSVV